jgi:hypothetical protein
MNLKEEIEVTWRRGRLSNAAGPADQDNRYVILVQSCVDKRFEVRHRSLRVAGEGTLQPGFRISIRD